MLAGVEALGRTLTIMGVVLVALGLLIHLGPSIPYLGKLPGDIRIERPGFTVIVPVASCLLISVVVSAALHLFAKLR